MSSNSPINGVANTTPISYLDDTIKANAGRSKNSDQSKENSNQIQSVKDLKIAELQGRRVDFSDEQMIKAIEKANKALLGATTSFEFAIHKNTHEIMVKVIDKDTGETIREIPPEKTLDMVAKMWELAGILVDKKA